MNDLTKDSIAHHILTMAAPVAISMLTHIANHLVNLYFITRIGASATAGVAAAGNAIFILVALMQMLAVGTVALVAHAVGRKDRVDANLIFNQSMMLSAVCGLATAVLLCVLIRPYLRSVAADEATVEAGTTFVLWVLPGYATAFALTTLSSALRGTGIVRPTIALYMLAVFINTVLAPVLIAGWGTGLSLGVMGAGLATTISLVAGTLFLGGYFSWSQHYLTFKRELMRPQLRQWRRILAIGLPAGCEIALMFFSTAVVYYCIRNFGASAQAGFGIGSRVLQTILLPGLSIALAAGPIIGQNLGAGNNERVREAFRTATIIATAVMAATTLLVQWKVTALVGMFDADPSASVVASKFLQLISWTFVAQGLIYTCSSSFQGLGNTVPALISSFTYFFVFSILTLWISMRPGFHIEQVWYVSIGSVTLQAAVSLWLLSTEFRKRLLLSAAPTGNSIPSSARSTVSAQSLR